MPPPDLLITDALDRWLAEVHGWLLDPGSPNGLELAAERAGFSSSHLHNLLTGRRPVLLEHIGPLGRAIGLDARQTEGLARLVREGGGGSSVGTSVERAAQADVTESIAENRARLRDARLGRWGVRAWVWTLTPDDARSVFAAGQAVFSPRTSEQTSVRIRVFLRAFPVSVNPEESSGEAEIFSGSPLISPCGGATVAFKMNSSPVAAEIPDVLDFLDYRDYLLRYLDAARARGRRVSNRWLGIRLGVSGGQVANVLARRRKLDPATAASATSALGLRGDRADYLPLLVEYNDATDGLCALYAWRKLSLIRARHGRPMDERASSVLLLRWYIPVVLELSMQPGWREDPSWVAAQLRPPITTGQAADAISLLRAAGYLPGGPACPPEVVRAPELLRRELQLRFHDECLDTATDTAALGLDPWLELELDVLAPDGDPMVHGQLAQHWHDTIDAVARPMSAQAGPAPAHLFLAHVFWADPPPP